MDELYISDAIALNLLNFAARRGVQQSDMLDLLELDAEQLAAKQSKNGVVPFFQLAKAYAYIERKTGDTELGLHLGELYNMAALGIVGQLIQVSRTIREGIEKGAGFFNLTSNALSMQMKEQGDQVHLVFDMKPECISNAPIAAKHITTASMVFAFKELRFLISRAYQPLSVQMQTSAVNPAEYQRVFGCEVQFGAAQNQLSFDASVMDQPILFSDYELLMVLEKEACKRLTGMQTQPHGLENQVRTIVYALMDPVLPSFEQVAANLNMSPRSVQRKLSAAGTSYAKLTREIKKDLAVSYLKKDIPVKEVSYLMGYNEPSSFVNAFKKWFGKTPLGYKALL